MKIADKYLFAETSIAPLVTFRVLFGFMMLVSTMRFAVNGWIESQYIEPTFFFSYYGFEWVRPLCASGMYFLFTTVAVSAFCIMIGFFYRLFAPLFFVTFTYIELIDKTNYLNHYYFISIVAFLLLFVPAHRAFSVDVWRARRRPVTHVPAWTINILKAQLGLVYFFAGVAKLNGDWLFRALPLKIWLPAKSHVPVIGLLFQFKWTAYVFSWFGAFYDLTIAFFLSHRKTWRLAFATVVLFHGLTAVLFQIGMFPYIMILATTIFFPAHLHERALHRISRLFQRDVFVRDTPRISYRIRSQRLILTMLSVYFVVQLLLPLRYALYPGHLFWTEQGYRFSWRVMLMEKAGYTVFHIFDPVTGKMEQARNDHYLTPQQEKMMSTQADMILQFAHFLHEVYRKKGFVEPQVRVESYVTLNGRRSRALVDPDVDLSIERDGFAHKDWIIPWNEKQTSK